MCLVTKEVVTNPLFLFENCCDLRFKSTETLKNLSRDVPFWRGPAFVHIQGWVEAVLGVRIVVAISVGEVGFDEEVLSKSGQCLRARAGGVAGDRAEFEVKTKEGSDIKWGGARRHIVVCEMARAVEIKPSQHISKLDICVVACRKGRVSDEPVRLYDFLLDACQDHFLSVLEGRDFRVVLLFPFCVGEFLFSEEEPLPCAPAFWAGLPFFFL